MASLKPADALCSRKAGADIISEAIAEAAAAANWENMSAQALLLGTNQKGTERPWTFAQLEALQSRSVPCWVMR